MKKTKARPACPYCQKRAKLVDGSKAYANRPDLHREMYWVCDSCEARVGCHKGTVKPLGRLANPELRYWKIQAHKAFDPMWRRKKLRRGEAYQWLADQLGIKKRDCHIGMFDVEMCKRVVEVCRVN